MELSGNFFVVGVISSITASVVVLLASRLVTRILIPKIRGILLKVPDISGEWESLERCGVAQLIKKRFSIKQCGIRISAKLSRQHQKKEVLYNGTFQSGQLIMNFEENAVEGYIGGALVLKLLKNRKILSGMEIYFHHKTGQVVCSKQRFTKC